jgi:8-oxo-dGTP pyrophosphatase MutT (NUDIX family)
MSDADDEMRDSRKFAAPQRPRDAATLIVVRRDGAVPRILLGQRHENHAFLPKKFVFPGGRLDTADCRITPARDLDPATLEKLMRKMRGRTSEGRARGLACAAVREALEETGLLFGRRTPSDAPDLSGLVFFLRAITPPGRTRRFDSRFFVADARHISNIDRPFHQGSGELLDVRWFTLQEALALDLPSITLHTLGRLQPFLERGELPQHGCPVAFHYSRGPDWLEETL